MEEQEAQIVSLHETLHEAEAAGVSGPAWSLASTDLNANLVRLAPGERIEPHVNTEVDVLMLAVAGEGRIWLGEREEAFREGVLAFVPKGMRRAVQAGEYGVAYVTCHRRRAGLMPRRNPREHQSL